MEVVTWRPGPIRLRVAPSGTPGPPRVIRGRHRRYAVACALAWAGQGEPGWCGPPPPLQRVRGTGRRRGVAVRAGAVWRATPGPRRGTRACRARTWPTAPAG